MCTENDESSPSDESFNEQLPEHLAHSTQSEGQWGGLPTYTQPSDISEDRLQHSLRCLNYKQRNAYSTVLT